MVGGGTANLLAVSSWASPCCLNSGSCRKDTTQDPLLGKPAVAPSAACVATLSIRFSSSFAAAIGLAATFLLGGRCGRFLAGGAVAALLGAAILFALPLFQQMFQVRRDWYSFGHSFVLTTNSETRVPLAAASVLCVGDAVTGRASGTPRTAVFS